MKYPTFNPIDGNPIGDSPINNTSNNQGQNEESLSFAEQIALRKEIDKKIRANRDIIEALENNGAVQHEGESFSDFIERAKKSAELLNNIKSDKNNGLKQPGTQQVESSNPLTTMSGLSISTPSSFEAPNTKEFQHLIEEGKYVPGMSLKQAKDEYLDDYYDTKTWYSWAADVSTGFLIDIYAGFVDQIGAWGLMADLGTAQVERLKDGQASEETMKKFEKGNIFTRHAASIRDSEFRQRFNIEQRDGEFSWGIAVLQGIQSAGYSAGIALESYAETALAGLITAATFGAGAPAIGATSLKAALSMGFKATAKYLGKQTLKGIAKTGEFLSKTTGGHYIQGVTSAMREASINAKENYEDIYTKLQELGYSDKDSALYAGEAAMNGFAMEVVPSAIIGGLQMASAARKFRQVQRANPMEAAIRGARRASGQEVEDVATGVSDIFEQLFGHVTKGVKNKRVKTGLDFLFGSISEGIEEVYQEGVKIKSQHDLLYDLGHGSGNKSFTERYWTDDMKTSMIGGIIGGITLPLIFNTAGKIGQKKKIEEYRRVEEELNKALQSSREAAEHVLQIHQKQSEGFDINNPSLGLEEHVIQDYEDMSHTLSLINIDFIRGTGVGFASHLEHLAALHETVTNYIQDVQNGADVSKYDSLFKQKNFDIKGIEDAKKLKNIIESSQQQATEIRDLFLDVYNNQAKGNLQLTNKIFEKVWLKRSVANYQNAIETNLSKLRDSVIDARNTNDSNVLNFKNAYYDYIESFFKLQLLEVQYEKSKNSKIQTPYTKFIIDLYEQLESYVKTNKDNVNNIATTLNLTQDKIQDIQSSMVAQFMQNGIANLSSQIQTDTLINSFQKDINNLQISGNEFLRRTSNIRKEYGAITALHSKNHRNLEKVYYSIYDALQESTNSNDDTSAKTWESYLNLILDKFKDLGLTDQEIKDIQENAKVDADSRTFLTKDSTSNASTAPNTTPTPTPTPTPAPAPTQAPPASPPTSPTSGPTSTPSPTPSPSPSPTTGTGVNPNTVSVNEFFKQINTLPSRFSSFVDACRQQNLIGKLTDDKNIGFIFSQYNEQYSEHKKNGVEYTLEEYLNDLLIIPTKNSKLLPNSNTINNEKCIESYIRAVKPNISPTLAMSIVDFISKNRTAHKNSVFSMKNNFMNLVLSNFVQRDDTQFKQILYDPLFLERVNSFFMQNLSQEAGKKIVDLIKAFNKTNVKNNSQDLINNFLVQFSDIIDSDLTAPASPTTGAADDSINLRPSGRAELDKFIQDHFSSKKAYTDFRTDFLTRISNIRNLLTNLNLDAKYDSLIKSFLSEITDIGNFAVLTDDAMQQIFDKSDVSQHDSIVEKNLFRQIELFYNLSQKLDRLQTEVKTFASDPDTYIDGNTTTDNSTSVDGSSTTTDSVEASVTALLDGSANIDTQENIQKYFEEYCEDGQFGDFQKIYQKYHSALVAKAKDIERLIQEASSKGLDGRVEYLKRIKNAIDEKLHEYEQKSKILEGVAGRDDVYDLTEESLLKLKKDFATYFGRFITYADYILNGIDGVLQEIDSLPDDSGSKGVGQNAIDYSNPILSKIIRVKHFLENSDNYSEQLAFLEQYKSLILNSDLLTGTGFSCLPKSLQYAISILQENGISLVDMLQNAREVLIILSNKSDHVTDSDVSQRFFKHVDILESFLLGDGFKQLQNAINTIDSTINSKLDTDTALERIANQFAELKESKDYKNFISEKQAVYSKIKSLKDLTAISVNDLMAVSSGVERNFVNNLIDATKNRVKYPPYINAFNRIIQREESKFDRVVSDTRLTNASKNLRAYIREKHDAIQRINRDIFQLITSGEDVSLYSDRLEELMQQKLDALRDVNESASMALSGLHTDELFLDLSEDATPDTNAVSNETERRILAQKAAILIESFLQRATVDTTDSALSRTETGKLREATSNNPTVFDAIDYSKLYSILENTEDETDNSIKSELNKLIESIIEAILNNGNDDDDDDIGSLVAIELFKAITHSVGSPFNSRKATDIQTIVIDIVNDNLYNLGIKPLDNTLKTRIDLFRKSQEESSIAIDSQSLDSSQPSQEDRSNTIDEKPVRRPKSETIVSSDKLKRVNTTPSIGVDMSISFYNDATQQLETENDVNQLKDNQYGVDYNIVLDSERLGVGTEVSIQLIPESERNDISVPVYDDNDVFIKSVKFKDFIETYNKHVSKTGKKITEKNKQHHLAYINALPIGIYVIEKGKKHCVGWVRNPMSLNRSNFGSDTGDITQQIVEARSRLQDMRIQAFHMDRLGLGAIKANVIKRSGGVLEGKRSTDGSVVKAQDGEIALESLPDIRLAVSTSSSVDNSSLKRSSNKRFTLKTYRSLVTPGRGCMLGVIPGVTNDESIIIPLSPNSIDAAQRQTMYAMSLLFMLNQKVLDKRTGITREFMFSKNDGKVNEIDVLKEYLSIVNSLNFIDSNNQKVNELEVARHFVAIGLKKSIDALESGGNPEFPDGSIRLIGGVLSIKMKGDMANLKIGDIKIFREYMKNFVFTNKESPVNFENGVSVKLIHGKTNVLKQFYLQDKNIPSERKNEILSKAISIMLRNMATAFNVDYVGNFNTNTNTNTLESGDEILIVENNDDGFAMHDYEKFQLERCRTPYRAMKYKDQYGNDAYAYIINPGIYIENDQQSVNPLQGNHEVEEYEYVGEDLIGSISEKQSMKAVRRKIERVDVADMARTDSPIANPSEIEQAKKKDAEQKAQPEDVTEPVVEVERQDAITDKIPTTDEIDGELSRLEQEEAKLDGTKYIEAIRLAMNFTQLTEGELTILRGIINNFEKYIQDKPLSGKEKSQIELRQANDISYARESLPDKHLNNLASSILASVTEAIDIKNINSISSEQLVLQIQEQICKHCSKVFLIFENSLKILDEYAKNTSPENADYIKSIQKKLSNLYEKLSGRTDTGDHVYVNTSQLLKNVLQDRVFDAINRIFGVSRQELSESDRNVKLLSDFEWNYNQDDMGVNFKDRLDPAVRAFFATVPRLDAAQNVETDIFGTKLYYSIDDCIDTIVSSFGSKQDVPKSFYALMDNLKTYAERNDLAKALYQHLKKLQASDNKQLINQIQNQLCKHVVKSRKVLLTYDIENNTTTSKVLDISNKSRVLEYQLHWKTNMLLSENLFKPTGRFGSKSGNPLYKLDKKGYDGAIRTGNAVLKLLKENPGLTDAAKRQEAINLLTEFLSYYGIELHPKVYDEIIIDTDFLTAKNGLIISLRNTLQEFFIKNKDKVIDLTSTNLFSNSYGHTSRLAYLNSLYYGDGNVRMFYDNGKMYTGFTDPMMITDELLKVKVRDYALKLLNEVPYSSHSLLLRMLADEIDGEKFGDLMFFETIANEALKDSEKLKSSDNTQYNQLSFAEQLLVKISLNTRKTEKQFKYHDESISEKALTLEPVRVVIPTCSDKSRTMVFNAPGFHFDERMALQSTVTNKPWDGSLGAVLESLYEAVIGSEVTRIFRSNKGDGQNIEGYSQCSRMFLNIPALNTVMVKDGSGKEIQVIEYLKNIDSLEELDKTDFKKSAIAILKNLISTEADRYYKIIGDSDIMQYNEKGELVKSRLDLRAIQKSIGLTGTIQYANQEKNLDANTIEPQTLLKAYLHTFVINELFVNANLNMMITGDLALFGKNYFKNDQIYGHTTQDYVSAVSKLHDNRVKRMAALIAPGTTLAESANSDFIELFVDDVVTPSDNLESLINQHYGKKALEDQDVINAIKDLKDENSPTYRNSQELLAEKFPIIAPYLNNTATDGQQYMTASDYIQILYEQGQISTAIYNSMKSKLANQYIEEQLAKAEGRNPSFVGDDTAFTDEELRLVFQPLKPVYTGNIIDNGTSRMVYIKTAIHPLIPQLTVNMEIDGLRILMERTQKRTGKGVCVTYLSGCKVGSPTNRLSLFTNDGKFNQNMLYDVDESAVENVSEEAKAHNAEIDRLVDDASLVLPRSGMRIQLNIPYEKHTDITFTSQTDKLLFSAGVADMKGFSYTDEEGNTTEKDGRELSKIYDDKKKELHKMLFSDTLNKFNLKVNEDGTITVKDGSSVKGQLKFLKSVYRLLQDDPNLTPIEKEGFSIIPIRSGLNMDVIGYRFLIPLGNNPAAKKIEARLQSAISEAMLKLRFPGYSYVTVSSTGFRTKSYGENELSPAQRSRIIYTEKFLEGQKNLRDSIVEERDGKPVLRPPQVFLPCKLRTNDGKIISFFNDDGTPNSTYVDVLDDGTMRLRNVDSSLLEGVYVRIPTSSHALTSVYEIAGFLPSECGDMLIVPPSILTQKSLDFDGDKEYGYHKHVVINDDGRITPLTRNNSSDKKAQLENDIIEIMRSVLSNPSSAMQQLITRPVSIAFSRQQYEQFFDDTSNRGDLFSPILGTEQMVKMQDGSFGKSAVGIYANAITLNGKFSMMENKPQFKYNGKPIKSISFGKVVSDGKFGRLETIVNKGVKSRQLCTIFDEALNLSVDNAKEGLLAPLGIDRNTINVHVFLSYLGINNDIVTLHEGTDQAKQVEVCIPYLLFNQPVIKRFNSLAEQERKKPFNKRASISEVVERTFNELGIAEHSSCKSLIEQLKSYTWENAHGIVSIDNESDKPLNITGPSSSNMVKNLNKKRIDIKDTTSVQTCIDSIKSFIILSGMSQQLRDYTLLNSIFPNGIGSAYADVKARAINVKSIIDNSEFDSITRALLYQNPSDDMSELTGNHIKDLTDDLLQLTKSMHRALFGAASDQYFDIESSILFNSDVIKASNEFFIKSTIKKIRSDYNAVLNMLAVQEVFRHKRLENIDTSKFAQGTPLLNIMHGYYSGRSFGKHNFIDTVKFLRTNKNVPDIIKNNLFIKNLFIYNDKSKKPTIGFNTDNSGKIDVNDILSAASELYTYSYDLSELLGKENYTTTDLIEDLFMFQFMQGNAFGLSGMFKYMPKEILKETGYAKYMNDQNLLAEYLKGFYNDFDVAFFQNNTQLITEGLSYIPGLQGIESFGNDIQFGDKVKINLIEFDKFCSSTKVPKFIKFHRKNGSTELFYLIDTAEYVYVKIPVSERQGSADYTATVARNKNMNQPGKTITINSTTIKDTSKYVPSKNVETDNTDMADSIDADNDQYTQDFNDLMNEMGMNNEVLDSSPSNEQSIDSTDGIDDGLAADFNSFLEESGLNPNANNNANLNAMDYQRGATEAVQAHEAQSGLPSVYDYLSEHINGLLNDFGSIPGTTPEQADMLKSIFSALLLDDNGKVKDIPILHKFRIAFENDRNNPSLGNTDISDLTIRINRTDVDQHVILHEIIHALSAQFIEDQRKLPENKQSREFKEFSDVFNQFRNTDEFKRAKERMLNGTGSREDGIIMYAGSNLHEFIALCISDPTFQNIARDITIEQHGSLLSRIITILRNFLNTYFKGKSDSVTYNGIEKGMQLIASVSDMNLSQQIDSNISPDMSALHRLNALSNYMESLLGMEQSAVQQEVNDLYSSDEMQNVKQNKIGC